MFLTDIQPDTYASLDILPQDQTNPHATADLLTEAKTTLSDLADEQGWDKLHVTVYLFSSDHDRDIPGKVSSLAPVILATNWLYTDRHSFSAATVLLPAVVQDLFSLSGVSVPHVSLTKAHTDKWQDTGPRLKVALGCTDFFPIENSSWSYSPSCGLWRKPETYLLLAKPRLHPLK